MANVISRDAPVKAAVAHGWANIDGYGDNGAVLFCASHADAADGDRAPRLLSSAPAAGEKAWLRLNHPFVFDNISPFWCLYLPPVTQWHGPAPEGDDLSRLALVRCRLTRAPIRDEEDGAAARVAVVETLSLVDLARGPSTGVADTTLIHRLLSGPGALQPVNQGAYTVLTRDIEGDAGEWAILHHDEGAVDLLMHGRWDFDSDQMWAGRARLPAGGYQASFS